MAENIHLLPIWNTISLAWDKVNGAKKTIWAAIGVMLFFMIILAIGLSLFQILVLDKPYNMEKPLHPSLAGILQLIGYLFQVGILFIGIERARDLPIQYRMMFRSLHFFTAVKLIGLYILQVIIIFLALIPFILITILLNTYTTDISKDFFSGVVLVASIFLCIYLLVRMYLAPGIVIDKKLNPWTAIKASFQATHTNFWRLLIVLIIKSCILMISIIPLGIGLIWSVPFVVICYGVIYKTLIPNVL